MKPIRDHLLKKRNQDGMKKKIKMSKKMDRPSLDMSNVVLTKL